MLQRFVQLSTARCPKLGLTECELDGLRFLGGGEQATCGVCNGTYAGIVPEKCPFQSDLPNNLWHNTDMKGKKYEDRACCESGGTIPSESCPPFKLGGGATAGIVIGSVVFLGVSFFFLNKYMRLCRRARNNNKEQDDVPTKHSNDTAAPKLYESAIQPYEGMSMMLPPSAPPTNPKFDVKE